MNKKKAQAGNQLMFIPFIFLLVIVAGGIAIGVYMFYNAEYDLREIDSEILNYKIKECILNQDLNWELNKQDFESEFLEKCKLNKEVLHLENTFVILLKCNDEVKYDLGNEVNCGLSEKNKDYPKCTDSTFLKKINNEDVEFKIKTGSSQRKKQELA